MEAHLWAAVGAEASPFATIALLAGGVVGALLRVLVEGTVPSEATAARWILEVAIAATFGAVLSVPFSPYLNGSNWAGSSLGGAMTAYAGASAFYAYVHARAARINPVGPALAHLLAATSATTVGFVLGVSLWQVVAR